MRVAPSAQVAPVQRGPLWAYCSRNCTRCVVVTSGAGAAWCSPLPCHCGLLLKLANKEEHPRP